MKKFYRFTLFELLVSIAILLVLISLLQPALQSLNQRSQDLMCKNNLAIIYRAIVSYADDNNDSLPGPVWYGQKPNILTNNPKRYNYLSEFLRPYFPDPLRSSQGVLYNPTFICPTNHEIETSITIEARVNYRTNYIKGFGIPFGRRANGQKPKKITELPVNKGYLLQDADDINYPYFKDHLPDLPVHSNLTRNTLFLGGQVGVTDLAYLTVDP